jgi:transketolase N-terminal domain/subunit
MTQGAVSILASGGAATSKSQQNEHVQQRRIEWIILSKGHDSMPLPVIYKRRKIFFEVFCCVA